MKHLMIYIAIAGLTFLIGVAATSFGIVSRQASLPLSKVIRINKTTGQSHLSETLHDFRFVGSGIASPEIPSHGMRRLPLPSEFKAGQQYVFHYRPVNNDLLFEALKNRFRSNRIEVLDAVRGPGRFIGGLMFRITFQDEKYRGYISNTMDSQIARNDTLSRHLSYDDYVLVIEEVKNGE